MNWREVTTELPVPGELCLFMRQMPGDPSIWSAYATSKPEGTDRLDLYESESPFSSPKYKESWFLEKELSLDPRGEYTHWLYVSELKLPTLPSLCDGQTNCKNNPKEYVCDGMTNCMKKMSS